MKRAFRRALGGLFSAGNIVGLALFGRKIRVECTPAYWDSRSESGVAEYSRAAHDPYYDFLDQEVVKTL